MLQMLIGCGVLAACCVGWVLFCPCWTVGVCIREHPDSADDLAEDPCWPCFSTDTQAANS